MTLKIIQLPVGPLVMNATLVMDIESRETIFFDPGDEIEMILDIASKEKMNIVRLIATHCHVDHIAGANLAMEKLSDEFKDKANFYYADIDENAINSASAAGVRGVPTVVVYKKGQEVARKVGGLPEQQMREFLKENLS